MNETRPSLYVAVGQVWEHVGNERIAGTGMRMRITQIPGGRKRTYRWVGVDPKPGGNGRVRRAPRKLNDPLVLARMYRLVPQTVNPMRGEARDE